MEEPTSAEVIVAQVAAPSADRERTNWLVQEVPAYSANSPVAPVSVRAEVSEETVRLVEVAVPETVRPPAPVPFPIVVEAVERSPPVNESLVEVASLGKGYAKKLDPAT